MTDPETAFERHLDHCNNAVLPDGRRRLFVDGEPVGFVDRSLAADPSVAPHLDGRADGGLDSAPDRLAAAARALAGSGRLRLRGEAFDLRSDTDQRVLGRLDRGALPAFGIAAMGVHLNGLVVNSDGICLWVARRAADKLLDPGKLDHLAAGGVAAGDSALDTLRKEAAEECGLGAPLIDRAVEIGRIRYHMARPEGLRRDLLVCYDVPLPADWTPVAHDGEVESFALWPLARVFETVRDTDEFKFNVNLVLIDLFLRHGLIDASGKVGQDLRHRLAGLPANRDIVEAGAAIRTGE